MNEPSKGKRLAGEFLAFFGVLLLFATGVTYTYAIITCIFWGYAPVDFHAAGYFFVVVASGVVLQVSGQVLIRTGDYFCRQVGDKTERQILWGNLYTIIRDVGFILSAVFVVATVFAFVFVELGLVLLLMALAGGSMMLVSLMRKKLRIILSTHGPKD